MTARSFPQAPSPCRAAPLSSWPDLARIASCWCARGRALPSRHLPTLRTEPELILLRRDDLNRLRHDLPRRVRVRTLPDIYIRRGWRFRLGIADVTPGVS